MYFLLTKKLNLLKLHDNNQLFKFLYFKTWRVIEFKINVVIIIKNNILALVILQKK